jgi:hypothetical protein
MHRMTSEIYLEKAEISDVAQLLHAPGVHRALFLVWLTARTLPDEIPAFDVLDLDGKLWGHLAYSDAVGDGEDFRMRVVGELLASTLKEPFVGRLVSEMPFPPEQIAWILEENRWVYEHRRPLYVRRRGAALDQWQELTRLILPVSDGAGGVRVLSSFYVVSFTPDALRHGADSLQAPSEPE